jgi:hypothetical protein
MKMLRSRKKFGRCSLEGTYHSFCEVTQEIQSQPMTRAKENAETEREIREQLTDSL